MVPAAASAEARDEETCAAPLLDDGWDVATIPDAVDVEHLIRSLGETRPAPLPRQGRPREEPEEQFLLSSYPSSPSRAPAEPMTLSRQPPPAPGNARWGWAWMGGAILVGLAVFASVVVMSRAVESSGPAAAAGETSTPTIVSAAVFDVPAPRTPRLEAIPEPSPPRAEPRRAAKRAIASASAVGASNGAPTKKPIFGDW
ncbi:MAG: hypothetical protein JOZ69_01160 [Myxococcales bacterium]|nr:hypothetical protein [Myxococcales bacterium]